MRNVIVRGFAGLGLALALLVIIGAALDMASFDGTKGGYEPPYTDYTGEPINWDDCDVTETGMVRRGYVVHTLLHCTSSMISFEIFRQEIPFRKVSERGVVVHKPREACIARGFAPEF